MSGSKEFYQRCTCGAEIKLTEIYDFLPTSKNQSLFEQWQQEHAWCLSSFGHFQESRQIRFHNGNQKLMNGKGDK